GMDASFVGSLNTGYLNRGNGYPAAYKWILNKLPSDAMVLDCSSGDRKYPDERVLSFEYMPFELPDIYGDGHCLPFSDNTFDAVFSQAAMEHMRDPYLAAKEISRITKPGGLIYIESAFMQPLHGVPYHFFNTTIWGIQSIFNEANFDTKIVEWFGSMADMFDWFLNSCEGGNLTTFERSKLHELLCKVDYNITYQQLKSIASSVSFWGVKQGHSLWDDHLGDIDRPSFKYVGFR
ncbi:Methyltransferase type 11, partial [mine drainage metagenome]